MANLSGQVKSHLSRAMTEECRNDCQGILFVRNRARISAAKHSGNAESTWKRGYSN